MPEVMEAEASDSRTLAQAPPRDLHARIGEGVTLALNATVASALGDIGEHMFRVMPAQWPENFAEHGCDRHGDQLAALAGLSDLSRSPINLVPFQQALGKS